MELANTPFAPRAKELDPVVGFGYGNRAAIQIPSGPTYHSIEMVTNVLNPKDIELVTITLNGASIIELTGEMLVAIQKHKKTFTEAGRYVIDFGESEFKTKAGVRMTDLVTLAGESWFLNVTMKQSAADPDNAPQIPSCRLRAHVLPSQSVRYFLPTIRRQSLPIPSAGRHPINYAEKSILNSIKRIHFISDDINRVRVLRDNTEEYNVQKADNAFDLARAEQQQNEGYFTVDFTRFGFGSDGLLNTAASSQLVFEIEKAAAGHIEYFIESVQQVTPLPQAA